MDTSSLQVIYKILNQWLDQETIPEEELQSLVVLIFKKGNLKKLDNYCPISLLNVLYKIDAAIIQRRLSKGRDYDLQHTQYGFRKNRGTADAIHCIRRVIDKGESTNTKTFIVLLDWEKAFDSVTHESIFLALNRFQVPTKLINIIKSLYSNPHLFVEIDGIASNWHPQSAGIRQGCPLSHIYLLLLCLCIFMIYIVNMKLNY